MVPHNGVDELGKFQTQRSDAKVHKVTFRKIKQKTFIFRDTVIEGYIGRNQDPVEQEKRLELFRVKD
jgi:hypothetical protein